MSLTYDVWKDDVRAGRPIDFGFVVYVPERTCRNVHGGREFRCSECGSTWHLLSRGDALAEWEHVRDPGYCPSCGARVIEEQL